MFAGNEDREWILSNKRKELRELTESKVTFLRKMTSGQTLNLIRAYEKIHGTAPLADHVANYIVGSLSEYEFIFGVNAQFLAETKKREIDQWFEAQENWVARKLAEEE